MSLAERELTGLISLMRQQQEQQQKQALQHEQQMQECKAQMILMQHQLDTKQVFSLHFVPICRHTRLQSFDICL